MIKIFLMLMTLMLVNGLDTQIADAGELDHEFNRFLVQSNVDLQDFVTMEESKFYEISNQTLQMDEVITDVGNLGSHQVGFTDDYDTNDNGYSEILIDQLLTTTYDKSAVVQIAKFDFG